MNRPRQLAPSFEGSLEGPAPRSHFGTLPDRAATFSLAASFGSQPSSQGSLHSSFDPQRTTLNSHSVTASFSMPSALSQKLDIPQTFSNLYLAHSFAKTPGVGGPLRKSPRSPCCCVIRPLVLAAANRARAQHTRHQHFACKPFSINRLRTLSITNRGVPANFYFARRSPLGTLCIIPRLIFQTGDAR